MKNEVGVQPDRIEETILQQDSYQACSNNGNLPSPGASVLDLVLTIGFER